MANLMDRFSDAATQELQDGEQVPVAPAFNRAATEKDAMTTEAAIDLSTESPILETARIIVPEQSLSDDAFAAVKRGDALRLKSLLDSGLDVNVRDEQGFTLLMRATQEGATEMAQDLLIRQVDPMARSDAGLTALMLAATNGNVEIAQLLLDEIEDTDLDADDDIVAEELALEHGNMSVFFAIQAKKRRAEFNKVALDENENKREKVKEKKACEEPRESIFSQVVHYAEEKEHKIAESLKHGAQAVGHAGVVVGHAVMEGCHAAFLFCSSFFQHKAETATPQETAEMAEAVKEVQKTVALIAKVLPPDPNKKV